jgi:formylglycine-generating enzyme required for sulfatase activity
MVSRLIVAVALRPAEAQLPSCPGGVPLTEAQLTQLVKGSVPEARLQQLVTNCGVAFEATDEVLGRLRAAGMPESVVRAMPRQRRSTGPKTKVNPKDGLTYVWIPPGTFMMGCSPSDTECEDYERPAHSVVLTKGFWIGETEVTQSAYQRAMGSNPSVYRGERLPVESITWNDAQNYCQAVTMRLPTEAEWEYAARGGNPAARYGAVDSSAWYSGNSVRTHEVATKKPNRFGLYDTLGNVWEWVADWYGDYREGLAADPKGPSSGIYRVVRGGSWGYLASLARASNRNWLGPYSRNVDLGVRCAGN